MKTFLYFINNNLLPNWPVTSHDLLAAHGIFSTDTSSLRGKGSLRKPLLINSTPCQLMFRQDIKMWHLLWTSCCQKAAFSH